MGIYIDGLDMPKKEPLPECHDLIIGTDGKVFIYGNFEDEFKAEQIDLVRCGECKWSYTDERDGLMWCKVHMSHYRVNADHFCSYGERRADEYTD